MPRTSPESTTVTIPAAPEDVAAVFAQFERLAEGVPDPPADADLTPLLPDVGGVAGRWVNASGRRADAGVVVYVHGGGFMHTEPRAERLVAYHLSKALGRPVFGVDYRLAPAHPYPAALEDVLAVYDALLARKVDVVLFGESAGGTLVLSALLALKADGRPLPRTVAVSPIADMTLSSPALDADDGGRGLVGKAVLEPACAQYLAGARPDRAPQSPLHGDLSGLPDLLLVAGAAEGLADDARRFVSAAAEAGSAVGLDLYEGMPHVFHLAMLTGVPLPTTTTFLRRLADWGAA